MQGEAAPPATAGGGGSSLPRWLATRGEVAPPLTLGGGGPPLPQWLTTQAKVVPPLAKGGGRPPLPYWLEEALRVNRNINLGMVADTGSSDSLPASSNAAAETPVHGYQRSQEKTPKKTHKAEREKLKRDQLNDLFLELGTMLDLDRQNTGKATVLGDAARVLRDLVTQVESLRKEQSALLSEQQYVGSEKNELQEENATLKSQISELANELCARIGSSSLSLSSLGMPHPVVNTTTPDLASHPMPHQMWGNSPNLSSVSMTHQTNTVSPVQIQQNSAVDLEAYALRPQELQLFPGPSSPLEHECSGIRSAATNSSTLIDSLPGQLCLSLTQSTQDESNSCVSGRRKER